MSITIGNLINESLNDNRLKVNTYNNSNVINLNNEDNTYNDAIINFKNNADIGYSNSLVVINYNKKNIFNTDDNNSRFNNNIIVRDILYTSNDKFVINSNCYVYNNFSIINSNDNIIFQTTSSNLKININNSNKLLIDNNSINFSENVNISSNYSLILSNIKSFDPSIPIYVDYASFSNILINKYSIQNSIVIDNNRIYANPTFVINRYPVDFNMIDIYEKKITTNSSNRLFSVNKNGFIGIGSNISSCPIDIKINSSNVSNIFNYNNLDNTNDKFIINNKGYLGIGTDILNNQLNINVNDDKRNIVNYPIINLNLNYNQNSNYRTSNVVNLQFIASNGISYIYNNEDTLISSNIYTYDNFINKFSSYTTANNNNSVIILNALNIINNEYIESNNISNIVNYRSHSYSSYSYTNLTNNINFFINFSLQYPSFLNINTNDTNETISYNPYITSNSTLPHYYVNYIYYALKEGTVLPITNTDNLILKQDIRRLYIINPNDENSLSIFLIQKFYIEKNVYELKNFVDSLTYIYQPPANLLYATSNNNFSASLSSEGKLALGDKTTNDNYYLYVNKLSRLNNLECDYFKSVNGKNNINFSYCNISNINKSFINCNISTTLISSNALITNCIATNFISSNINVNDIFIRNLNYSNIYGNNFTITSNLFNPNIKIIVGTNTNLNSNQYFMNININSNFQNGLAVQSFDNNLNPSIAINGFTLNSKPFLIMSNLNSAYSINLNANNKTFLKDDFSFINNKNNTTFLKYINYNDNLNNQLIFGCNNVIFNLKYEETPTNTTNKISLGFPYRYLMQNQLYTNGNNWENQFKENTLNNDCMLNVYGNVNLSSIYNTSFIKCVATEFPNETISINIAGADNKEGFVFNVKGNSYFSSNINVDSNVFVKGTIGNVSDIRLKYNIMKINNAMNKINEINGYIYKRKDTGKIETGLIAQEVIKVLPEIVSINNLDGYYNISYGNIVGLLVEGIKELNKEMIIIKYYIYMLNIAIIIMQVYLLFT